MACLKCGSSWTTITGREMASCPECCKQQRCKARRQGRIPATAAKICERCGLGFETAGSAMSAIRYCPSCQPHARQEYLRAARERLTKDSTRRRRLGTHLRSFLTSTRLAMNAQVAASRQCEIRLSNLLSACRQCFKPFVSDPRRTSRFCSWKCCVSFAESRVCITCGSEFELRATGRNAKSKRSRPECGRCVKSRWRKTRTGRSHAKKEEHRTRCRKHGVPYDPAVKPRLVFERDGYRCHLCNRKTLLEFAWVKGKPHARSPTVDHVIPLSAGVLGHQWHNVKCCCWGCNVRKGARWDKQLPLLT